MRAGSPLVGAVMLLVLTEYIALYEAGFLWDAHSSSASFLWELCGNTGWTVWELKGRCTACYPACSEWMLLPIRSFQCFFVSQLYLAILSLLENIFLHPAMCRFS